MNAVFRRISTIISGAAGSPYTFLLAISIVVLWWVSGPAFGYSDTWQLMINTGTTIVTFLMVFLIQNTQNRDAKAIQIKLDELLRATKGARTGFINMEELSDEDLVLLQSKFQQLRQQNSNKMLAKLHESVIAEQERRGIFEPLDTAVRSAMTHLSNATTYATESIAAMDPNSRRPRPKKVQSKGS